MAVCYIAGASPEAVKISPRPGDFLIAADGGWERLTRWGLKADLVIGDMDSLAAAPAGVPCKSFPRQKDATDLALAIEGAIARGYAHIILTGAWGGRPDHSVGNLQLLANAAKRGVQIKMLCGDYIATALTDDSAIHLKGHGTVSVFAYGGQVRGVTIRGLEYTLDNATLRDDTPLGVSNTLDGEGEITLEHGTLLVFYQEGILCAIE